MNRLDAAKRATILDMLVEGSSLRSISRITGVSINTVTKLLVDAGEACISHHDEHVRGVAAKRVQVDEIWQFCYAQQRTVETAKAAPEGAGDTWTWTALDADSKLIVSWLLGQRHGIAAYTFMHDPALRLTGRVQLTSDGLRLYEGAVEDAFGADVDYAQLIKMFGDTARVIDNTTAPSRSADAHQRGPTGPDGATLGHMATKEDMRGLRAELIEWMVGTGIGVAGVAATLVAVLVRFLVE